MTTLETFPLPSTALDTDELAQLQLRVARRADLRLRQPRGGEFSDRRLWLVAEYEILEQMERAQRITLLGGR